MNVKTTRCFPGRGRRPDAGELGIVEFQEMAKTLPVIEDVDLDRRLVGVDSHPEVGFHVVLEPRGGCGSRGASAAIGKLEKTA